MAKTPRAPSSERVLAESCGTGGHYRPTTTDSTEDDFGTDEFGNERRRRFADEGDAPVPLDKLFR